MSSNIYRCHRKTYFNSRMFQPGMRHVGMKANKHFTLVKGTLVEGDMAIDPNAGAPKQAKSAAGIGEAPGANEVNPGGVPDPNIAGVNDTQNAEISDEDIRGVLRAMDHKNDKQWTADGKPLMTHVETMLGGNITRKRLEGAMPGFGRGNMTLAQAGDPSGAFI